MSAQTPEEIEAQVGQLNHVAIKEELLRRNLLTTGNMLDLRQRLRAAIEKEQEDMAKRELAAKMREQLDIMNQVDRQIRQDNLDKAMAQKALGRQNKYSKSVGWMPLFEGPERPSGWQSRAPRFVDASRPRDRALFRPKGKRGWFEKRDIRPLYGTQEEPSPSPLHYTLPTLAASPTPAAITGRPKFKLSDAPTDMPGPNYEVVQAFRANKPSRSTVFLGRLKKRTPDCHYFPAGADYEEQSGSKFIRRSPNLAYTLTARRGSVKFG
eukprot:g4439.t1